MPQSTFLEGFFQRAREIQAELDRKEQERANKVREAQAQAALDEQKAARAEAAQQWAQQFAASEEARKSAQQERAMQAVASGVATPASALPDIFEQRGVNTTRGVPSEVLPTMPGDQQPPAIPPTTTPTGRGAMNVFGGEYMVSSPEDRARTLFTSQKRLEDEYKDKERSRMMDIIDRVKSPYLELPGVRDSIRTSIALDMPFNLSPENLSRLETDVFMAGSYATTPEQKAAVKALFDKIKENYRWKAEAAVGPYLARAWGAPGGVNTGRDIKTEDAASVWTQKILERVNANNPNKMSQPPTSPADINRLVGDLIVATIDAQTKGEIPGDVANLMIRQFQAARQPGGGASTPFSAEMQKILGGIGDINK